MTGSSLKKARDRKYDEFYTRMGDIEKEIPNYDLRGKSVICPCDGEKSNFYIFFKDNFQKLGLKCLTVTCLNGNAIRYDGINEERWVLNDGDFLNKEVFTLIEKSDIVITNPPFSQIIQFVPMLEEIGKDFLLVAPYTCLHYTPIFPYMQKDAIRFGHNFIVEFDNSPIKMHNVGWVTTLAVESRPYLPLVRFSDHTYDMLDDGSALCVNKLAEIPGDYDGIMAVPCTILAKINHKQFQLIGLNHSPIVNGKCKFKRILIKRRGIAPPPQSY